MALFIRKTSHWTMALAHINIMHVASRQWVKNLWTNGCTRCVVLHATKS